MMTCFYFWPLPLLFITILATGEAHDIPLSILSTSVVSGFHTALHFPNPDRMVFMLQEETGPRDSWPFQKILPRGQVTVSVLGSSC